MPMVEGIGRSGYRALASLLYALGLAALLVSLSAHAPAGSYEWLAFGLTLASLSLLWGMGFVSPPEPLRKAKVAPPKPAPVAAPAAAPPRREAEFEYTPPRRIPETLVLPPAFQDATPADPKAWPARRAGRGTRGELARRYTQRAPVVRGILTANGGSSMAQVPELLAMPGHSAIDGMAKGKCGGCGMLLAAPPERPVRLRCPGCGKGTLLR